MCLDVELWWIGCTLLLTFVSFHSGTDTKCRVIDDVEPMETCGPYVSREKLYYLPFKEVRREARTVDLYLNEILKVMRPALSSDCSANLLSLLCRTWFRECQEVPHDTLGSTMLPSLMVRSMILESELNLLLQC